MTVVGITAGRTPHGLSLDRAYVDAVLQAGGTPLVLPVGSYGVGRLDEALSRVDVLLLSGGGDIDPRRYGARPTTTLHEVDTERDEAELQAVAWALESGRRMLGVCRGAQLLVVATGGTLIQDLPAAGFEDHLDPRYDRTHAALRHGVKATPDSLVGRLMADVAEVNSHHHQAVDLPGEVLVPTAWTGDGVIEALEAPDLLALQWHPESLIVSEPQHLGAFRWLVTGEG